MNCRIESVQSVYIWWKKLNRCYSKVWILRAMNIWTTFENNYRFITFIISAFYISFQQFFERLTRSINAIIYRWNVVVKGTTLRLYLNIKLHSAIFKYMSWRTRIDMFMKYERNVRTIAPVEMPTYIYVLSIISCK